jgi:hypothetical protein
MSERKGVINVIALLVTLLSLLSIPSYADEDKTSKPQNFVTFNGRIQPDEQSPTFSVPSKELLVITDVVIQNRRPGDEPVDPSAFSRVDLGQVLDNTGSLSEHDIFFTVVGNETLNLHFVTGLRVPHQFRVLNVINSSATFIEFTITGFLTRSEH